MKRIYKYELEITDTQQIETHKFCQILSVQMQNDKPYLWVVIDEYEPMQKLNISMFGTGYPISKNFYIGHEHNTFCGTIQQSLFVWHVFANGYLTTH